MPIHMIKTVFFIVALLSLSFSDLLSGTDSVNYNHALNFFSNTDTMNMHPTGGRGFVFPCTTSIADFDLFVAEEMLGTCIYICHTLAVGSPRPFYVAKKEINLSSDLNLNDTSYFAKIDTVRNDKHETWNTEGCYLPHINPAAGDSILSKSKILLVLKNSQNRYVFAVLNLIHVTGTYEDVQRFEYSYDKGYLAHWFLQTDGTTNFYGAEGVKPGKQTLFVHQNMNDSKKKLEYFSIRGQKISKGKYRNSNLIFERTGENLLSKRIVF